MKKNLLSILLICLTCMLFSQQASMNITNYTGTHTITCTTPSINLTASVTPSSSQLTYSWVSQSASYSGSNVSIAASGVYTVTASNASISVSQTLTIRTNTYLPQASISPASASITCISHSVNLLGTGTSGIPQNSGFANFQPVVCTSFSGPSTLVNTCSYTASTAGIYTLTVTDLNNGCSSITTRLIADNRIYPQVDPNAPSFNILCPNSTATIFPVVINNIQNLTYSWTPPFGAITSAPNGQFLVVNSPGNYKVFITNVSTGCSISAMINVVVCVGVSENTLVDFKLYPNPTTGDLKITSTTSESKLVQIYSTTGSLIKEQLISNEIINISDLPAALYFVKLIVNRQQSGYVKLVKLASN